MSTPLPEHAIEKLLADARPVLDESTPLGDHGFPSRYRIVREIGRGGMGVVYEAEDLELGRIVALKAIARWIDARPGTPDRADLRARFVREARAAARLSHPGIAAVFDATDRYIAMRLVRGVPLSDVVADGTLDRRALVSIVRDAALAVHAAHEQGVIHRDLKPGNVLVEDGKAVVTDFGLAKDLLAPRGSGALSLSGQILGTPSFMAPEQASGRRASIDARADVYGLGAVLFHALTQRAPFQAADDEDVVAVLRRVLDEDPPKPRAIDATIPRDLELVALRCLEKDPSRRYASARDLAADLDRWLEGRAVEARAPSFGYRTSRFVSRHKGAVALAGAAFAASLVAVVLMWNQRVERSASEDALALADFVNATLADESLEVRLGEMELRRERLAEGLARCEGFLAKHDVALVHALRGRLLAAKGEDVLALEALDRSIALDPSLPAARLMRGIVLATRIVQENPGIAIGSDAALSAGSREHRKIAIEDLQRALPAQMAVHASGLKRVDAAFGHVVLAELQGDSAAVRRGCEEVLRLDVNHVGARLALVRLHVAAGEGDEALAHAFAAVDQQRGLGPAYEARASRFTSDDVERAVRQLSASAAEQRVIQGDSSAAALAARGGVRLSIDDVEGALADFSAALEAVPTDALAHGQRGVALARRAAQLETRGDREGALVEWASAIESFTTALMLDPSLAVARNDRAVAYLERDSLLLAAGRDEEARAARDAALSDLDRVIEEAPSFGLARLNRAIARRRSIESAPVAARELDAVLEDLREYQRLEAMRDPSSPAGTFGAGARR